MKALPPHPTISRKPLALAATACLAVAALTIPFAAHLPKWIEWELVLIVWWLFWGGTLAWLLYRGHRVDDDTSRPEWSVGKSEFFGHALFESFNAMGCVFSEGCLWFSIAVLGFLLFGLALFLLVEFLLPALAVVLFASMGGMFARAANDTHGCGGRLGASLLWGFVWATVYTGPIVVIVMAAGLFFSQRS